MYVCMFVCMYVCMHVYMYVCLFVCMYACMYVCMYVYMFVCIDVCMHSCMHVCMYRCMTTSMYCLYVRVNYTYIDVNALAQGIKSFLASQVWFQAVAGAHYTRWIKIQIIKKYTYEDPMLLINNYSNMIIRFENIYNTNT